MKKTKWEKHKMLDWGLFLPWELFIREQNTSSSYVSHRSAARFPEILAAILDDVIANKALREHDLHRIKKTQSAVNQYF